VFFLYSLLKPLLFALDPEKSHNIVANSLEKFNFLFRKDRSGSQVLKQEIFGKIFNNPIQLAAGFDKYARFFPVLSSIGFGSVELGSFTKREQEGNEKPRIFRIKKELAILNRMGFNNPGIDRALLNIEERLPGMKHNLQIAISTGKSKETAPEKAMEDYLEIIEKIHNSNITSKSTSYIAVNISSPNTPGLRKLQGEDMLKELLTTICSSSQLPVVVKFSPDFPSVTDFKRSVELSLACGINGIIVTNTSTEYSLMHSAVPGVIAEKGGGLSGLPLSKRAAEYLDSAVEITSGKVPVIASGGIMRAEDIFQRLLSGASLVQIYTGFIYKGPKLIYDSLALVEKKFSFYGLKSFAEFENARSEIAKEESEK